MLELAYLIPILPLLGFLAITFSPIRRNGRASGWLCVTLLAVATMLALGVAAQVPAEDGFVRTFRWAPAGGDATFTMGFLVDPLAALMLVMVTVTSTCIHLFSLGYMADDPRQARFFSYTALFAAAMLATLIASNLLLFFIAWELMGLCSYLLIGFWYNRNYSVAERGGLGEGSPQEKTFFGGGSGQTSPEQTITPREAAIKAFITTRIGDVLLMIGLVYLWTRVGSLDIGSAPGQIFDPSLLRDVGATTWIALLIFCGTIGKSAQFPLHVWLPDAMEGPTPVSALIHAATMVAAGVFLVVRTFPIFEASAVLPLVAFIGTLTALGAALVACTQWDIKRILAYSTMSQLGLMVAALGVGAPVAALFHLLTHAFFKALLFLGSGSVIHGMETVVGHDAHASQDIRRMGGLRRVMPITFATYAIGYLALAGVPPLAGFWSKDEILSEAWSHNTLVWLLLTLTTFLTAFYMTRQVVLVFGGTMRSRGEHVPHESGWTMTAPLLVLAIFAVVAGFFPVGGYLGDEPHGLNMAVAVISTVVTLAGMSLGWALYRNAAATGTIVDPLERNAPAVFALLHRRLGIDVLYAATFGRVTNALAWAWNALDRLVIGRLVDGIGALSLFLGRLSFIIDDAALNGGGDALADGTITSGDRTRRIETGKIQDYVALVFGGVVLLGVVYLYVLQR